MTDDKTKLGPEDSSRINVEEEYEVTYWTEKFGVSADELRQAVEKVGTIADAVAIELGKPNI